MKSEIINLNLVSISNANPVDFGWLRWSGGIPISLGIGALLASRDVGKQGVLVRTISLGYFLAGLGLLYSWLLVEFSGATWFIALPTLVVLVVYALLWWSRQRAKEILWAG